MLLVPCVSFAAPMSAATRATLLAELAQLESELETVLSSSCTTGMSYQNGSCQWTASSTEAVDEQHEERNIANGTAEEETNAAQLQTYQQEYQEYVNDALTVQAKAKACESALPAGANGSVSTSNSGITYTAATVQAVECENLQDYATVEAAEDAASEQAVQTKINAL